MPAKKKSTKKITAERQTLNMYTFIEYLLVISGLAAIWFAIDILNASGHL